MGTRQLLEGEEVKKDGKTFQQLTFGDYSFESFADVDEKVRNVSRALEVMGLSKGDHVVIFAETRAEWMQTALACFKVGLPGRIHPRVRFAQSSPFTLLWATRPWSTPSKSAMPS